MLYIFDRSTPDLDKEDELNKIVDHSDVVGVPSVGEYFARKHCDVVLYFADHRTGGPERIVTTFKPILVPPEMPPVTQGKLLPMSMILQTYVYSFYLRLCLLFIIYHKTYILRL